MVGCIEGWEEGRDGFELGCLDGCAVGCLDGCVEGWDVGFAVYRRGITTIRSMIV